MGAGVVEDKWEVDQVGYESLGACRRRDLLGPTVSLDEEYGLIAV